MKVKTKLLSYDQSSGQVKFLEGKILTIIEGIGLNERQEKAVKDMARDDFGHCINAFWRHCVCSEDVYPDGTLEE